MEGDAMSRFLKPFLKSFQGRTRPVDARKNIRLTKLAEAGG